MSLFIVATPIGNRSDITLRALQTLFSVYAVLCEDTRKTKQLLDFYLKDIPSQALGENPKIPVLLSFFEHNEAVKIPQILGDLKQGAQIALVSNAGTPIISDPGYLLVKACHEAGIKVITIPGSSALTSALSISGLSTDKVQFLGFLPRKHGKQTKIWQDIFTSKIDQTVVFYESPFRLKKTLANINEIFGDIEITVARELTKVHETVQQGKISNWLQDKKTLKGELVVLFRTHQE